jgi:hypothetical protein
MAQCVGVQSRLMHQTLMLSDINERILHAGRDHIKRPAGVNAILLPVVRQ